MKRRIGLGAFALVALALAGTAAGESPKSGLPVGGNCNPFHPLNLTGPDAGTKQCLV